SPPNDKDHRPRASHARLETAALSRGSVHPLVRQLKCPSLKNSSHFYARRRPAWPCAGNVTARDAKHTKRIARRRGTSRPTNPTGDNGENRGSIQSLFRPLPPVQKSQRRSLMQRTTKLTDRHEGTNESET